MLIDSAIVWGIQEQGQLPSACIHIDTVYHDREVGMGTQDFARFVAKQQVDSEINWAGMRDEWLRKLDFLHAQIRGFLSEYVEAGSISYSFTNVEITEEDIGKYLAPKMEIKIGRQVVVLEPIGTLLIGSAGRVDVIGSAGRAQIILVDEKAKSARDLIKVTVSYGGVPLPPSPPPQQEPKVWVWKIVNRAAMSFDELTKESFFKLLMEVANA